MRAEEEARHAKALTEAARRERQEWPQAQYAKMEEDRERRERLERERQQERERLAVRQARLRPDLHPLEREALDDAELPMDELSRHERFIKGMLKLWQEWDAQLGRFVRRKDGP